MSRLALLAVVAMVASEGAATDYYVSTGGSDGSGSGSLAQPWRTVQYGLDQLGPGDTLHLLAGTYHEKVEVNVSGLPGAPVTLTNHASGSAILDGSGLTGASAVIGIYDQSYVVVEGLTVTGNAMLDAVGIGVEGAGTGVVIRANLIHDIHFSSNPAAPVTSATNAQPLIVYGTDPVVPISDLVIDGNEIRDCRTGFSEALAVNGNVDGFVVVGNQVHDITNIGIDLIGHEGTSPDPATDQARNGVVRGNTVSACVSAYATSAGIYVDGARDLVLEGNTSFSNGWGIEVGCEAVGRSASGIVVRSNLVYANQAAGIALGGYDYPGGSGKVTTTTVTNNTLFANDTGGSGGGELALSYNEGSAVADNVVVTGAANLVLSLDAAAAGLALDYNLYHGPAGAAALDFAWNGPVYHGLPAFQAGTGRDAHSLSVDPALVSAVLPSPDLHLSAGSPAVDRGDPAYLAAPGETDVDGDERVSGGRVDLGADELGCGLFCDGFESGSTAGWSASTP